MELLMLGAAVIAGSIVTTLIVRAIGRRWKLPPKPETYVGVDYGIRGEVHATIVRSHFDDDGVRVIDEVDVDSIELRWPLSSRRPYDQAHRAGVPIHPAG